MSGARHVSAILRNLWRETELPPHLPLEREWRRTDALAADDAAGRSHPPFATTSGRSGAWAPVGREGAGAA